MDGPTTPEELLDWIRMFTCERSGREFERVTFPHSRIPYIPGDTGVC